MAQNDVATFPTAVACKNCGFVATESFCAKCGQKTTTGRLDVESFLELTIEVVTHATGRVWHTFWELSVRPTRTLRAYLDGRRKPFLNPVSFFAFGYLLFEIVNALIIEPQHLPESILTRLGRTGTFLGMTVDAVAAYLIVTRPTLNFVETLTLFAFMYGVMFVDASLFVMLLATSGGRLQGLSPGQGELLLDVPLLVILVAYFVRIGRTLLAARTWRLLSTVGIGLLTYVAIRTAYETQLFSALWDGAIAGNH